MIPTTSLPLLVLGSLGRGSGEGVAAAELSCSDCWELPPLLQHPVQRTTEAEHGPERKRSDRPVDPSLESAGPGIDAVQLAEPILYQLLQFDQPVGDLSESGP